MLKLTHYPLDPFSRAIRLALSEFGVAFELQEEKPWEWRPEFLALNPAGDLPVLQDGSDAPICGFYAISEYLDETLGVDGQGGRSLFPGNPEERAEVRRLVDWFNRKFHSEAGGFLLEEKLYLTLRPPEQRRAPDMASVRVALANLKQHQKYLGYLADQRSWLAGDALSFADLVAAAHLSCIDYLGEVPWELSLPAHDWYARIKSRPAFRPLLADQVPGKPPPSAYADLDF